MSVLAVPEASHLGTGEGRRLLITGASGYIGTALVKAALLSGWTVTCLGRAPDTPQAIETFPWRLGAVPPDRALIGTHAVIHLAHQWAGTRNQDDQEGINVCGTARLLAATRRHGVPRFVFASTVSARRDALNAYGRQKWAIEQTLQPSTESSARIGLVYGGPDQGLWGLLCRLIRLPILPMVGANRSVQPIRIDELCDGLLRIAAIKSPDRAIYGLASPELPSFGHFLRTVARIRFGRAPWIIPLPLPLVLAAVDIVSKVVPTINRERIYGLAGIPTIDNADDLRSLGLSILSLTDGLAPFHRRRALLIEARGLLRYVGLARPSLGSIRRYVRGVEKYGEGYPLPMSRLILGHPTLLRLVEPLGDDHDGRNTLTTRLEMALILAESEPAGARLLYDYHGVSPLRALIEMGITGVLEALIMPFRLILGRRR